MAVPSVRERLDAERRTLDAQYALDRVLQEESEGEGFFAALDEVDAEQDEISTAAFGWLQQCLNLHASSEARGLVAYHWTSMTLLPKYPCQSTFKLALDVPYTADRQRAVSSTLRPRPRLIRLGSPLVNAAEQVYIWDDRGTAFATWRVTSNARYDGLLAFKVCYFVEGRIPEDLSASEQAATRARLDGLFSPSYEVFYLDADLRSIEDKELLALLEPPYLSNEDGGADYNMGSRLNALYGRIDAFRFEQLCRMVREASERQLRENPIFAASAAGALERGRAYVSAKLRRIRLRMALDNEGAVALEREIALIDQVENTLPDPSVSLDSIGAIILSNQAPTGLADD